MRAEAVPFDASVQEARRFFARDDVRATVPCTVLDAVLAGVRYSDEPPDLFRVVDGTGAAVLFALRTPPHPLVLALGPAGAAAALGHACATAEASSTLSAVTGPDDLAGAFADAFTRERGRPPAAPKTEMVLYRLDRLASVTPPSRGSLRAAVAADVPRLVTLVEAFQRDVGSVGESPSTVEKATNEARLLVWDVAGEIVSIVQRSPFTETTARVRLVYTPPEHRGRGYAAACVGAMSERILAARSSACLFADAANATSNALYRRLGFAAIERHVTLSFG